MKVFKFKSGEYFYAYAAETKELAIEEFTEQVAPPYFTCEEIPESEWDKKTINIWEDNNFDKKPYKVSIRESIIGTDPQLIFTNDYSSF